MHCTCTSGSFLTVLLDSDVLRTIEGTHGIYNTAISRSGSKEHPTLRDINHTTSKYQLNLLILSSKSSIIHHCGIETFYDKSTLF